MVTAHITQVSKYGQPRSEYLRLQSEIVGNTFPQSVTRYVGVNVVQITERQDFCFQNTFSKHYLSLPHSIKTGNQDKRI